MKNGQGTHTYPDGRKYEGEWKDGKFHGQGTWTHPDGDKYVGEWKDGKRSGQGTYTYPSGSKYEGEWKDGKRSGQGTHTYPDGRKYKSDDWIGETGESFTEEDQPTRHIPSKGILEMTKNMICPHCQTKGSVTTKQVKRKKGIHGGKATAAIFTLGVSMIGTGLSRKQQMTEASCSHCGAVWNY